MEGEYAKAKGLLPVGMPPGKLHQTNPSLVKVSTLKSCFLVCLQSTHGRFCLF